MAKTIATTKYVHRKRIGSCPLAEHLQVMTAKKRQKKPRTADHDL